MGDGLPKDRISLPLIPVASRDSPLLLPAMVVAGAIGGALWAAIPALLRTRFNANEILVSLMLVKFAAIALGLSCAVAVLKVSLGS